MKKQGAKKAVPRLRFPEFRQAGSWRETKLGVIAESESSSLALNKVALEPQGFPLFGADGLVGRIAFFEQPDGYIGIVKDGSGVGRLTLLPAKSSVLGTLAYVKPALGAPVSLDWLFHCMASLNLKKYVKGSGIPHIYFADYSNEPIGLPAPAEQQKIADCLTSLDEVIAAQGRKVDALKAHKRGLMQQLFPREAETRPRLRFPEAHSSPEWHAALLGDVSTIVRGGSPRPIDDFLTVEPDGLNWLKIGDVDREAKYVTATEEKVRVEALSKTRVIGPGDFILSNSMSFGRPYISTIEACIHDGWIAVTRIHDSLVHEFLYYSILSQRSQTYFADQAAGSGVQNLNKGIIELLPVAIPSKQEQQRIADCLSSLDTRITAETARLAALKTHKQGLMQQLFPAPEATGA